MLSAKLFMETDGTYVFGPGRLALLKAVRDLGSLRKAALHLGMSYRWAWGRIKTAEAHLGVPLLASDSSSGGRSKSLTPEAAELIAWFDATERELDKLLRAADKSMPDSFAKARSQKNKAVFANEKNEK